MSRTLLGMPITDARPRQVRIADDLRADIEAGRLAPGAKLPTLEELAEQYRCSLGVVRKSFDLLRQQGLITTRQGLGSFVRVQPRRILRSSDRHSREKALALLPEAQRRAQGTSEMDSGVAIADLAFSPQYRITRLGERGAEFGLPPESEALEREFTSTDRATGYRQSHSVGWIPTEFLRGNPELFDPANEPWPGGTHHQLSTVGIEIATVIETVTASMPRSPEARAWGMDEGIPLLHVRRKQVDIHGRTISLSEAEYPADRTELRFTTNLEEWS